MYIVIKTNMRFCSLPIKCCTDSAETELSLLTICKVRENTPIHGPFTFRFYYSCTLCTSLILEISSAIYSLSQGISLSSAICLNACLVSVISARESYSDESVWMLDEAIKVQATPRSRLKGGFLKLPVLVVNCLYVRKLFPGVSVAIHLKANLIRHCSLFLLCMLDPTYRCHDFSISFRIWIISLLTKY